MSGWPRICLLALLAATGCQHPHYLVKDAFVEGRDIVVQRCPVEWWSDAERCITKRYRLPPRPPRPE